MVDILKKTHLGIHKEEIDELDKIYKDEKVEFMDSFFEKFICNYVDECNFFECGIDAYNVIIILIDRYYEKLSDKCIYNLLTYINYSELFDIYIDKYEDKIRSYLIKNTITRNEKDRENFKFNCDEYKFYKKFRDVIDFDQTAFSTLLSTMNIKKATDIIIDLYHKDKEKLYSYINSKKFYYIITYVCENDFEMGFDLLYNGYKEAEVHRIESIAESELNYRKDIDNNKNDNTSFTYNLFKKINYLSGLPKKDREKHPYYKECYDIYYNLIKNNISDLEEKDDYIIRKLFHRIISGAPFTLITNIDNKASLYLYYKTNIYFKNENGIDSNLINNIHPKQWIDIYNSYINSKSKDNGNIMLLDNSIVTLTLEFDYYFVKKLIESQNSMLNTISGLISSTKFITNKDAKYKNKLKKFIKDYCFNANFDIAEFNRYYNVFEYLYHNDYSKLTYNTIKSRINDISCLLFPNNYHIETELDKLDFINKGDPYIEKIKGIVLYNKYRKRISSSIPNYKNYYDNLEFGTVDMHDKAIISNGIGKFIYPDNNLASSCLTPNGKASTCLEHGALNPNGRFFYIKKDGKILAYSWMWRRGNLLCFDNIEVTEDYLSLGDKKEEIIYKIYKEAAKDIIKVTEENEDIPITSVIIGRNPIDVTNSYFDNLSNVKDKYKELFKPLDSENLYMNDSSLKQVILIDSDKELYLDDVSPKYLVDREVNALDDNMNKVNSIYFDYCIENCVKYKPLSRSNFKYGVVGNDWFYGETLDGEKVLFDVFDDERKYQEISKYKDDFTFNKPNVGIIREKGKIDYLLNSNNYIYNEEAVKKYIDNISSVYDICEKSYFHAPQTMEKYVDILNSKAIKSAFDRDDENYGYRNGKYFISVALVDSACYDFYSNYVGFLINKDIMAFTTTSPFADEKKISFLTNESYYVRPTGGDGEFQVYGAIGLDKVDAIMVPKVDLDLAKVIYINEEYGYDFPIIQTDSKKIIDSEEVKQFVKLK